MARWPDVLALATLLLLCGALRAADDAPRNDPDRWFHYAVSRQWVESGRPLSLPGPEDLGWTTAFPEKEFLFHAATAQGFRAAGPAGVDAVGALFELLAVAGLYVLARQWSPMPFALLLVLALVPASHHIVFRLELVRALGLAVACFVWLMVALKRGAPLGCAVAAGAYALAYHAWYVPLLLLVAAGVFAVTSGERRAWMAPVAGLAGLVVGVLVNPYFPLSASVAWELVLIALMPARGGGQELQAMPLSQLVYAHGFALAAFGLAALMLRRQPGPQRWLALTFFLTGAAFWLLAVRQPRAAEYAVPLTVPLVAMAFGGSTLPWPRVVLAAGAAWGLVSPVLMREPDPLGQYLAAIPRSLEVLRAAPAGTKVLNTSFDEGTVLAWVAPSLRFVDLLDPRFLERHAPELSRARDELRAGRASDPAAVVACTFHAQAVATGSEKLAAQLDADPRFRRLEPPPEQSRPMTEGPYVYALAQPPSCR